jgi:hypothetical protein
LKINFQKK